MDPRFCKRESVSTRGSALCILQTYAESLEVIEREVVAKQMKEGIL